MGRGWDGLGCPEGEEECCGIETQMVYRMLYSCNTSHTLLSQNTARIKLYPGSTGSVFSVRSARLSRKRSSLRRGHFH